MRRLCTLFVALYIGATVGICDVGHSQETPSGALRYGTDAEFPLRRIEALFLQRDGGRLWAVGDDGAILNYVKSAGVWKVQSSGSTRPLYAVFATTNGSEAWAVGEAETVLHYSSVTGSWHRELGDEGDTEDKFPDDPSEPIVIPNDLAAVYGSNDGAHIWAVGDRGTIVTYSPQKKEWRKVPSGTKNHLRSIFGTSDGKQFWAVGWGGTILHFTEDSHVWHSQASGTRTPLRYLTGTQDGKELWAVGNHGTVLHYSRLNGVWRREPCLTSANLISLTGNAEASNLIATANDGTQFQYSAANRRWELIPSPVGTTGRGAEGAVLAVAASADGSELWKADESGKVRHLSRPSGSVAIEIIPNENWVHDSFQTVYALHDGSQVWATGMDTAILHYTKDTGVWRSETRMSSSNGEELLFGNAEGTKVWCLADELYTPLDNQGHWTKVKGLLPDDAERRDILRMLAGLQWDGGGNNSELYHYLPNTGRWEAVTPYPHRDFFAIASTPGGAQVWAEGLSDKEVVHFPSKDNQWELQPTEGHYDVRSFFITNDGNAGWSVGVAGQVTQLVSGRWERNNSGTSAELDGISGSADASELWAVGAAGTILHYSALNREWRVENGPFIVQDSTIGDALTRNH